MKNKTRKKQNRYKVCRGGATTRDRKDVTENLKQQVLQSVDVRDGWMW